MDTALSRLPIGDVGTSEQPASSLLESGIRRNRRIFRRERFESTSRQRLAAYDQSYAPTEPALMP